jgi:CRISPR type III-A-associated RAMP protein Csm5
MADKITQQSHKMVITPLTDIHVGTGEVINPGEYFVFDGDLTAYFVDLGFIGSKNEKISSILLPKIGQDGWVDNLRQIKGFKELITGAAYGKSYLGDDTYDIHEKWGSKNTSLTVNLIHRGVKGPYIPGSSIKGCIRTALVAVGCRDRGVDLFNDRQPAESERKALGARENRSGKFGIDTDPLNILKIPDCFAKGLPATVLHRVSREGMAAGKEAAELQDYRECLPGLMTWSGQDAENIAKYRLAGNINITHNMEDRELSKKQILQSCDAYYKRVLKIEKKYWEDRRNDDMADMYDAISSEVNTDADEALIRIGWGSGFEALSIPGGKPPKTRALVGGFPAGWAILRME